ncbi:serine protease [Lentzea sp. NBRC 105346]|uniref:S1 family peptidase n=1 Tax=Lentzea sp. NBRC 105346 TaxID=3032205 RepID=UPI0024A16A5A|nr:serine protease [Lentzea sp. NBRC 105346]GLZ31218.1 serine protease [Lentzea sp. NBRC 105346]
MAKTLRRLFMSVVLAALASTVVSLPASADVQPNIVGGTRASTKDYPWVVFLASTSNFQFCGGTLVKANKVVTAAHCVKGRSPASTRVVHGRDDKQSNVGTNAAVTKIWVHPSYTTATKGFDVAVLTLDRAITSATLPLATPADASLYKEGNSALILGWGTTSSGGSASRYLLKANVPLTSDATCKKAYPQYSNQSMVCAGFPQGGVDTCQGDSGGPLVFGGKLIGDTSWGQGCAAAGYPGVYGRIAPYYAAINAQL